MGWVTLLWSVALLAAGIGIGAGLASEGSRGAAMVWLFAVFIVIGMAAMLVAAARRRKARSEVPEVQVSKTDSSPSHSAEQPGSEPNMNRGLGAPQPTTSKATAMPESVPASESASNHQPAPEPKPVELEPTPEQPKSEPTHIRTRTGVNTTGRELIDPYADSERPFTADEDKRLLELQAAGGKVWSIANDMGIDQRQIAIRLIRLLFAPTGPINDEAAALNNGATYADGEKDQIEREYRDGVRIEEIAQRHGRTVLAIGWLLIDRPGTLSQG